MVYPYESKNDIVPSKRWCNSRIDGQKLVCKDSPGPDRWGFTGPETRYYPSHPAKNRPGSLATQLLLCLFVDPQREWWESGAIWSLSWSWRWYLHIPQPLAHWVYRDISIQKRIYIKKTINHPNSSSIHVLIMPLSKHIISKCRAGVAHADSGCPQLSLINILMAKEDKCHDYTNIMGFIHNEWPSWIVNNQYRARFWSSHNCMYILYLLLYGK